jgi:hypothetical protein
MRAPLRCRLHQYICKCVSIYTHKVYIYIYTHTHRYKYFLIEIGHREQVVVRGATAV